MFNTTEKRERRLGTRLFLKGTRCQSPKCVNARRPHPPGVHGKDRQRPLSEFGQQLQEKQKFQWSYGLREAQLKRVFKEAIKNPAVTGDIFLSLLERRLDNVAYRLGFASSRAVGRQLVGHGHLFVNGRRVTIPSYRVHVGDVITIRPQSKEHAGLKNLSETMKTYEPPTWLSLNKETLEGKVASMPKDFDTSFDVNMVVDYYSKVVK
ncbi:MAG: 30S ribosomal protein S4 [Patescibacteria group bacterium]